MLRWYLNNNSEPLKSGEKYKIEERKTRSKCKKDFLLTIVNATENDEGTYGCRSLCEWGNVAAIFELNITDQASGKKLISFHLRALKQFQLCPHYEEPFHVKSYFLYNPPRGLLISDLTNGRGA